MKGTDIRNFKRALQKEWSKKVRHATLHLDKQQPMKAAIEQNGKKHLLNLENTYRDYQKRGEEAFESLIHVIQHTQTLDHEQLRRSENDHLLKIIRPLGYGNETAIKIPINQELQYMYVFDHPEYAKFVEKDHLHDLFTLEDLEKTVIQNQIKHGWVTHQKDEHSPAGIMQLYQQEEQDFAIQFFNSLFYEEKIGREFYVILPTKTIVMTLIPNHSNKEAVLEGVLKLKEFAIKLSAKEPHPISEKVFHVENRQLNIVG